MTLRQGLCTLLLLVPAAIAAGDPDPLLQDDLRFADNLARYRYVDLALQVLRTVRAGQLSPDAQATVNLAEARIDRKASEATADVEQQLQFQTAACDLLQEWTRPGTPLVAHEQRPEALTELADLLHARARLRSARARTADAAAAGPLRALADADFRGADGLRVLLGSECEALARERASAGRLDEADALAERSVLALYGRALNSLDWADLATDEPVRVARLEQAYSLLGDYQWELGEESLAQSFAVHFQGVALHRLGRLDEALALQREVLDKARWAWDNRMDDPIVAPVVTELCDRAWGEVAALQTAQGDPAAADATLDAMLAAHAAARAAWGRPGLRVLLDRAAHLEARGQSARALDIVKLVSDRGVGQPEGSEASDLLATLVAGGSSGTQAGARVLLAAGQGLYDREDYAEAAFVYARAAAASRTDEERRDVLVEAWLGAGRAYAADRRPLEAALAFEHALDAAVAFGADDATRESAATGLYNSLVRRFSETHEAFDKALKDAAGARLIALGVAGDLAFADARDGFDAAAARTPPDPAAFLAAADELKAVAPDAPSFERALVYQGRALAGAGRAPEALAAYDALLARAADPARAPDTAEGRSRRELALAEALHYKAELLLSDAVRRPDDALAVLAGFETRFPAQTRLGESARYQRVVAHAMRGDVEAAAAAVAELEAFAGTSSYLRLAWFRLSDALLRASEAARAGPDPAAADALLVRAVEALWTSAELGRFPSFTNLASSGAWAQRAGRPDLALRSYAKALEVFDREGSGIRTEQLDEARLGLALACNATRDFARGKPSWQDLVKRRPTDPRVLLGAARGLGGWLELGPDGRVVEVAGSGDFGEAFTLWNTIFRSAMSSARYQRIWWEARLGTIYAKYRAGALDTAALQTARDLLDNLAISAPGFDEDTVAGLPADQQYAPLFKPLFQHLEGRIPKD